MVKKLIWTIILLSPVIVGLTINAINGELTIDNIFQGEVAIGSWVEFFDTLINDQFAEWPEILGLFIMAIFWTAPFWYAWKGTFIVGWIPLLGIFLRIIFISILLIMPPVFELWDSTAFISDWLGVILIGTALIGLWLKS